MASSAYRCGVIPQPAPDKPLALLVRLQPVIGGAAFLMAVAAVVAGGDGSVPTWLGLVVTIGVGLIAGFAVRWYRRRPIAIGDFDEYRKTVLVRAAISIDPAVAGTVMAFVGDSVWPAVIGAMISIVNVAMAPVSEDDYERHQIISIEEAQEVPEDEWGTADPKAVAPWDQLEEGHGHGMQH